MAYDPDLAKRVETTLGGEAILPKRMFGGIGYLLHGNMVCGIHGYNLIIRARPSQYDQLLKKPGARPFDMTGHPMIGWIEIEPAGIQDEDTLAMWINIALEFNTKLQPK